MEYAQYATDNEIFCSVNAAANNGFTFDLNFREDGVCRYTLLRSVPHCPVTSDT